MSSDERPRRSVLKFLMNAGIVCFFAAGVLVSAGSFGLFGCWCNEGFRAQKPPEQNWRGSPTIKEGEMPPLPTPPK